MMIGLLISHVLCARGLVQVSKERLFVWVGYWQQNRGTSSGFSINRAAFWTGIFRMPKLCSRVKVPRILRHRISGMDK